MCACYLCVRVICVCVLFVCVCARVCVCMHVCSTVHTLCFRRVREDLKTAVQRNNQMQADYGDVVPRRDYEQLQTAYEVGCS